MGLGTTMWDLQDRRYLRRDGENGMSGPLILSGRDPESANEAARKAYVDTLTGALPTDAEVAAAIAILTNPGGTIDARIAAAVLAYLPLAGGVMTGALTLAGAPVNALHAATMAYADLMVPLAGGVMGGFLTLSADPVNVLHAATKQYVDALPVGLSTYDAVVAAAGGDYTEIVTACATEGVGARIFVKRGTYNETANIAMKDGQQLIGENPEDTIVDFGAANRKILATGAMTNVMVANLTVQASIADYTVDIQGTQGRVINCRIMGTAASFDGIRLAGTYSVLEKCYINGFARAAAYAVEFGNHAICYGNTFMIGARGIDGGAYNVIMGNDFNAITDEHVNLSTMSVLAGNMFMTNATIMVSGGDVAISGNYINGANGIQWNGHHDGVTITGNHFNASQVSCVGFVNASECTITGNTFRAGSGVFTNAVDFTISGNTFQGSAFISLGANSRQCAVIGNNLSASTAATKILDAGVANSAMSNAGVDSLSEKDFRKMKNTSGGGLVAGDVVVLKAVAAGDEVTTTVNQGDDMVFGMVEDANIANAAYGYIQVEGKTVKLKVNGTVAIAIGDMLGTLNAVQISMKAAAGDMALAIALEVYAGADSNGVIDALLIKPRKV